MTTKEIIAAFRSGEMSEEEALGRLVSLCNQMRHSGVNAGTLSHESSAHVEVDGFRSSQITSGAAASIPLQSDRADQGATDEAAVRLGSAHRGSGTEPRDIAVIGMSGRFPDAPDIEQFWKNLVAGCDSVREVPGSRWVTDKYYHPDP